MNRTTIINIIVLWLAICFWAWGLVAQNKVNANEEILSIQKRLIEIDNEVQQAKDNWHIAEASKEECVQSWNEQQMRENEKATWLRKEKESLEKKLGLLLQSQLQ